MPSKVQQQKHHAALPYSEIKPFISELQKRAGISARALEFSILTVARSGEVRGAEWSEIDLKNKTWTIPASRMKASKEHRVPLSDAAIALLKALPALRTITLYSLPHAVDSYQICHCWQS
jgi:integrase